MPVLIPIIAFSERVFAVFFVVVVVEAAVAVVFPEAVDWIMGEGLDAVEAAAEGVQLPRG
jgi:predicted Na+-dependent transporter